MFWPFFVDTWYTISALKIPQKNIRKVRVALTRKSDQKRNISTNQPISRSPQCEEDWLTDAIATRASGNPLPHLDRPGIDCAFPLCPLTVDEAVEGGWARTVMSSLSTCEIPPPKNSNYDKFTCIFYTLKRVGLCIPRGIFSVYFTAINFHSAYLS